jgi:hypothetical protein
MSFDAGSITSTLGLDFSPFEHGILGAEAIAHTFPHIVTEFMEHPLLAVVDVAKEAAEAVKEAFLGTAESLHHLGIEAERAGVSVQFLATLANAGKTAGVGVEEVAHGLAFLSRNIAEAAQGNASAEQTFGRLGISVRDASGHTKTAEAVFGEFLDKFKDLSGPEQAQAAMDLLSRGGIGLLPVLKKGSEGIRELADAMRDASGGIREGSVEAAEKVGELRAIIDAAWTGIQRTVAQPILEFVSQHFEELKGTVIEVAAAARAAVGDVLLPVIRDTLQYVLTHGPAVKEAVVEAAHSIANVIKFVIEAMKLITPVLEVIGNHPWASLLVAGALVAIPVVVKLTAAFLDLAKAISAAKLASVGQGLLGGLGGAGGLLGALGKGGLIGLGTGTVVNVGLSAAGTSDKTASTLGTSIGTGSGVGAAIGSFFPGVGTTVGAIGGGLVGLIGGLLSLAGDGQKAAAESAAAAGKASAGAAGEVGDLTRQIDDLRSSLSGTSDAARDAAAPIGDLTARLEQWRRLGTNVGGPPSGAGAGGGAPFNIDVNIETSIDPDEASSAIARKIQPGLRRAVGEHNKKFVGAAQAQAVLRGL